MFPFRMFSSLAKGLGSGLGALNDVFVHNAMAQKYGPDWKEELELSRKAKQQQLELGESELESRRLENEIRQRELESKEAVLFAESGGLKEGETFSRSTYKGVPVGGTEPVRELVPVSRSEAIGERARQLQYEKEINDRRALREQRLDSMRNREIEAAQEGRARAAEVRAQAAAERSAAEEARAAELHPIEKRTKDIAVRRAEEDVLRVRALREKYERSDDPKEPKIPAGMFDDMVLLEARRLSPETEAGGKLDEFGDPVEGERPRLEDYPPEVIDQATDRVLARQSMSIEERRAARGKQKAVLDENVSRHESRRRAEMAGPPTAENVEGAADTGELSGTFERDSGIEEQLKAKKLAGEPLTPEESAYLRRLGAEWMKR